MTTETATIAALWVAVLSLVVSLFGIGFALFALWRGNRNSAASLALALYESFRQAWQRWRNCPEADKNYEFHDMMNLIESACAVHVEKTLVGVSRRLIEDYLIDVWKLIEKDAAARELIKTMRDKRTTFEYCVKFLVKMRSSGRLQKMAELMTAPDPVEIPPAPVPTEAANSA